MPQNPVHGTLQIVDDGVGLARPIFRVPSFVAEAVASANEDGFTAGAKRQLHVSVTVANHERARKIEIVLSRGLVEHSGAGLATVAAIGRTVRAIINRVEARTGRLEFALHALVHFAHKRLRKITTSHTGLIGDDDHGQMRFVQATDGRAHKRKHTKSVDVIQVADLVGDGAVAVEENGRAKGLGGVRHEPPLPGATAKRGRPFLE
jgi:hypothetical protein